MEKKYKQPFCQRETDPDLYNLNLYDQEISEMLIFYYTKNEDFEICECEFCGKLLLPFLIKKNLEIEEKEKIINDKHFHYYEEISKNFSVDNEENQKIYNFYNSVVHLWKLTILYPNLNIKSEI